tara:strand:- start:910 stop:2166 length:1257 start_codon:yes stop_codon:yes gene_type:complete
MTIGLQGEWGSGKTTLSNMIHTSIERSDDNSIMQIWINAWEYSLLSNPKESLGQILNKIIDELVQKSTLTNKAKNLFKDRIQGVGKGALRFVAGMTGGRAGAEVARELTDGFDSIGSLRDEIEKISNEIRINNEKVEKIVIYIDDLDRISPPDAVSMLELLKNVLCIPRCVFVLAIDYDIVVKGLKEKFGDTNIDFEEWEFKAFFDKIIQLPFTMPLSQYSIGSYVTDLLVETGFLNDKQNYQSEVMDIISYTIGGNPRSIKRLVNALSLIEILTKQRQDVDNILDDEDLLVFSLVCMQIEYPMIYDVLISEPNFKKWTQKDTAFYITKGSEEEDKKKFKEDLRIVSMTNEFDEEWEKALFRICYNSNKYGHRVSDISRLLTFIDREILKDKNETETVNIINGVLNKTLVTSIKKNES